MLTWQAKGNVIPAQPMLGRATWIASCWLFHLHPRICHVASPPVQSLPFVSHLLYARFAWSRSTHTLKLPFLFPFSSSALLLSGTLSVRARLSSAMASLASASLQSRAVSVVSSAVSGRNVDARRVSCVSFSGLRAGTRQRVSFVESRSIAAAPRPRRFSCAAEGAEEAVAAPAKAAEPRDVTQIVRQVIATQLASPLEKVLPESKFSDLGADSLDTVEIMMALEEEFDISIDEDGAEKISTVKEAADLIESELKSRA